MSEAAFLSVLVVDGALVGVIYALVALAFVVVYKASRMMNFALGEWVMLSSRLVASGVHAFGLGLLAAMGLAFVGMLALAVVWSRVILRRLAGQPLISLIMVSLGLGILIRGSAPLVFAGIPSAIPLPMPDMALTMHGVPIATEKLVAAAIAVVCIAVLTWFFRRSRTGVALRALANDPHAATAVGISPHRHIAIAWALAGALSVLAGTLWTAVSGSGFGIEVMGLKVFPVVIVGGLDSIPGTIVAAILIGVLESVAVGYLEPFMGGGFSSIASYLVLLGALFVRPHGLLGRPEVGQV